MPLLLPEVQHEQNLHANHETEKVLQRELPCNVHVRDRLHDLEETLQVVQLPCQLVVFGLHHVIQITCIA